MREMMTVAMSANEYRLLHRPDYRKTRNYANKISSIVTNCDINIGSLNLPAPEPEGFEEFLLLHNTADIRYAYNLISIKHTAAVLKEIMCDSARLFFLNIRGSCVSVSLQLRPSFTRQCFCSLRGYIVCICL